MAVETSSVAMALAAFMHKVLVVVEVMELMQLMMIQVFLLLYVEKVLVVDEHVLVILFDQVNDDMSLVLKDD